MGSCQQHTYSVPTGWTSDRYTTRIEDHNTRYWRPARPAARLDRGRSPVALRPVERVLPAVARPHPDLQLRILRARRHDAAGGADRQNRPRAGQARPATRDDAARYRLRLGLHADASDREIRRQRDRSDALSQPEEAHRTTVRRVGQPAQQRSAAAAVGGVRRAGRPNRVDRRVRALRLREIRLLLPKDLRLDARRRRDAAAHHRRTERRGGGRNASCRRRCR